MSYDKQKIENYSLSGGLTPKTSSYMKDKSEVIELENFNYREPGALTKREGVTLYNGVTVSGRINGLQQFDRLSGASYVIAAAGSNLFDVQPNSFVALRAGINSTALWDFVPFVDRLFGANGVEAIKTDGINAPNYYVPQGVSAAISLFANAGGLSGSITAAYGYAGDRGVLGPPSNEVTVNVTGGANGSIIFSGLTFPQNYGVSMFVFYRTDASAQNLAVAATAALSIGATYVLNFSTLSTVLAPDTFNFTLIPRYLEIYNNQLMLAGFSTAPSTVFWSEIGEPEQIQAQSFAEFRTNDGDVVRGIKSYLNDLIVAKERSIHRLSGEVPDSFSIQQISDEFGTVSNRTMVVFQNMLGMLDTKGVIVFDGARIDVLSTPIEPIVNRINWDVARQIACAVHDRDHNEVWWAVPLDQSTTNNCFLVYDYVSQKWTTYKGVDTLTLARVRGRLSKPTSFVGGFTGAIGYFDESVESDFGQGITCTMLTAFVTSFGNSTESQFRRFYLNVRPEVGASTAIEVGLYKNYETLTPAATFAIYQNPFQTRVDFGIPARVLAARITHSSASLSLKVYGMTVESRYQRSV